MRVTCQIVCYLVTLLGLLFLGGIFDIAFRQTGFHAQHLLGGKPLPAITEFLIAHHDVTSYLVLLPWLAFVGAPLLFPSTTREYWEPTGFFLRFTAFVLVEGYIFLLFVFAIALPFIPYYGVMEDYHETAVELTFRFTFWGAACLIGAVAVFGMIRHRRL